jgi:hypothetical protein
VAPPRIGQIPPLAVLAHPGVALVKHTRPAMAGDAPRLLPIAAADQRRLS